jgi:hypothetical protein
MNRIEKRSSIFAVILGDKRKKKKQSHVVLQEKKRKSQPSPRIEIPKTSSHQGGGYFKCNQALVIHVQFQSFMIRSISVLLYASDTRN